MNIWLIIYLFIVAMNLGINLVKHGEYKEEKYNFFSALIGACIGIVIVCMAIGTGF